MSPAPGVADDKTLLADHALMAVLEGMWTDFLLNQQGFVRDAALTRLTPLRDQMV